MIQKNMGNPTEIKDSKAAIIIHVHK
jgi:hypothetical protein